jgi:fructose-bisphosphate aldolase class 1
VTWEISFSYGRGLQAAARYLQVWTVGVASGATWLTI